MKLRHKNPGEIKEEVQSRRFKCDSCSLSYSYKSVLNRHKRVVHEGVKDLDCPKCDKKFGFLTRLRKHCLRFHGIDRQSFKAIRVKETLKKCEICDKIFASRNGYIGHMKAHEKEKKVSKKLFKCDDCEKEFAFRSRLAKHKAFHHVGRAFSCEIRGCRKAFFFQKDKEKHMSRRIKCNECDREFCLKGNLAKHKIQVHRRRPGRPLIRPDLRVNLDRNQPKPTQYDIEFQIRIAYRTVFWSDASEKSLLNQCNLCFSRFSSPVDLFDHQESIHNLAISKEEREAKESTILSCHGCDKEFIGKLDFCRHVVTSGHNSKITLSLKCPACSM